LAIVDRPDGGRTKAQRQKPIKSGWLSSAQEMTQDDATSFLTQTLLQFGRHLMANATQALSAPSFMGYDYRIATSRMGTLGNDDNGERPATLRPGLDLIDDFHDVVRYFGDQDYVGRGGDAGVQGYPSGISPHDFNDHHALVGLGR
jgi:hypothetical protein